MLKATKHLLRRSKAAEGESKGSQEMPGEGRPGLEPHRVQAAPEARGGGQPLPDSSSGPPALGRTSVASYLKREEVCAQAAPQLQHSVRQASPHCIVCQRLARVSADPRVQASAKATLRREAAELESVLALRCEEQGEEEALQGVGIEPTPPPQQFGATVRQGRDGDRQLETRHTA
ncbi:hypothetical protein CHLNCDRAFT_135590 [Chlorella variabilis]|uniref:Uncharacterized protein n=1 Tax=Chlorella variabilis TaxID=554065 RepID=E1ZIJ0_CHLVA|nr:hypothetical protein CHLNCDRAFT_135590 [Chlorella variabilis]EFN54167.1 hypothetical protein CHLNCDRAFT_135590 [Chlorella variabilis]|eukprot:XP_005846269.1 hypothetical protein CHLNCDRAFT_135590 [Chlorella variabilis]